MKSSTLMMRLAVGSALAMAVISTSQADGALTLTLSEPGYAPLTVTDSTNTGAISYFGTYGDFQTNFVAGLSDKLNTPTPPTAILQIQSIDVKNLATSGTKETITLTLTDDGYTFPALNAPALLESSFGGTFTGATAGDSTTFQSYVVAPAVTTGLQSYTAPATNPGTMSFSSNVTPVGFFEPAAYTLTNTTTISLTGAYEQANLAGTTTVAAAAVPEPTTLGLIGLVGAGLVARRRRTAAV